MKQKLDFTEIKEFCDKAGLNCQIIDEGVIITKPKDIWDGVEFAEFVDTNLKGKIYKIQSIDSTIIYLDMDNTFGNTYARCYKEMVKPSTEYAYIEQLKKEAFERFGEIKKGDRFNCSSMGYSKNCKISLSNCPEWEYNKKRDELTFEAFPLYKQGKWAELVKEKIEVEISECVANFGTFDPYTIEAKFTIKNVKDYDHVNLPKLLAQQLEKYLNGEIE